MRQAFTAALDNKDNIELLTFTFPHSINQSLEVNLKKLSQARQHFWRSAIAKKFRNAGYIGRIDSFEITHGSNGWHPHVHAIVFSNQKTKASHFKDQLLKQWIKSLYKFELANSLELKGIEHRTYVQVATHPRSYAIADEDLPRENEEKTSAVHFLRFELDQDMVDSVKAGEPIAVGIDLPAYDFRVDEIAPETQGSLIKDLK